MARCCDPFDSEHRQKAIQKVYLLGGLNDCDSCKVQVEETLSLIDGIVEAHVNLKESLLEVAFNPERVSEEHLKSTLNGIGFSVRKDIMSSH